MRRSGCGWIVLLALAAAAPPAHAEPQWVTDLRDKAEREGDRVVADVHSAADDAIVRIVGGVLVVIGLIGGALVLLLQIRRRRGVTLGIQLGLAVLVTVAGALLLLSSSVRRRFVPVAEVVVDHAICPRTRLGTCAKDTTCLQILDTPAREAIRKLQR